MSATQITLTDRHLESELLEQRKELARLQEKLQAEQRRLDAAKTELSRVVEAIERGATGKQGDLARAKEATEEIGIRIGGLQKTVAPIEAKILELKKESDRRQAAAEKAAFEKEYAELQEKGAAIASRILEKLKKLISEDLAEFDAIRGKLETRFASLGGQNAAFTLRRLLFDMQQVPNEAHIAALLQDGWEFRGPQLTGPLELTIRSMTHTAAESLRDRMASTVRP